MDNQITKINIGIVKMQLPDHHCTLDTLMCIYIYILFPAVDKFSEIADSLCVGQRVNSDEERVVLFLKMSNSHMFEERLVQKVNSAIRKELSARHVPALVLEISDIPVS